MKITVKELDEMFKSRMKLGDELRDAMMVRVTLEKVIRGLTKENDALKEKVSLFESEVATQIFRESGRPAKRYQIDETDNKVIIRRETIEGNGVFDCVGVLNDE